MSCVLISGFFLWNDNAYNMDSILHALSNNPPPFDCWLFHWPFHPVRKFGMYLVYSTSVPPSTYIFNSSTNDSNHWLLDTNFVSGIDMFLCILMAILFFDWISISAGVIEERDDMKNFKSQESKEKRRRALQVLLC